MLSSNNVDWNIKEAIACVCHSVRDSRTACKITGRRTGHSGRMTLCSKECAIDSWGILGSTPEFLSPREAWWLHTTRLPRCRKIEYLSWSPLGAYKAHSGLTYITSRLRYMYKHCDEAEERLRSWKNEHGV